MLIAVCKERFLLTVASSWQLLHDSISEYALEKWEDTNKIGGVENFQFFFAENESLCYTGYLQISGGLRIF